MPQASPRRDTITWHAPYAPPGEIRGQAVQGQEVIFLGWQKTLSGEIYPLYNILKAGHYFNPPSQKRPSGHSAYEFHGPRLHIPVWDHPRGTEWVLNWSIRQLQEKQSQLQD